MKKDNRKLTLLTFYKFVDIEDPHKEVEEHSTYCKDIGLRGRIYIGSEGISSTVSGYTGQIIAYKLYLKNNQYFHDIPDIDEKSCLVDEHMFDRMIVKYRKEIVALGATYKAKDIEDARYLISIDDFKKVIDQGDEDYIILDMRNNYEYRLGHFKNAIPAGTPNFRDLEKVLWKYREKFSNKKLIMYCTGGIRCEKAGVMLKESGIPNAYQLDGGIVKYINKHDDGNWLGNLYTFDGRVSCNVGNRETHTVIGKSHYSGESAEEFFNCRYGPCNYQIIANEQEYKKHLGFCSEECYLKSLDDLMIRDEDFDKFNYKQLRSMVKRNPNQLDELKSQVRKHLEKKLKGVEFNHKVPLKETLDLSILESI